MANAQAILQKVARNMNQRGIPATYTGSSTTVVKTGGDVLTVTYTPKSVQAPLGGVDGTTSPFLGIGVAAPGSLKLKGAAGENTLAAILDTTEAASLLAELAGYANDVVIEAGDTTTSLARIMGSTDFIGAGS